MRVVHVLHHSISPFAGQYPDGDPLRYDTGLPMKFARAIKARYDRVEVECWRPERAASREVVWRAGDGLTHRIFPSAYLRYNWEVSPAMLRCIRDASSSPDTCFFVHGSYNLHAYLLGRILENTPTILQSHGGFPARAMLQTSRHRLLRWIYPALAIVERVTLPGYARFYSISREELGYVNRDLPGARAELSPTGLNFDHFCPGDQVDARHAVGMRADELAVLFVGRLAVEKGLTDLVNAFQIVASRSRHCHLWIVGNGPLRQQLERQIVSSGLRDRVTLVGHVPPDRLPHWYRAADVSVMPSHLEWFGMVAAESMACGTPVVATRAGGAVDIVEAFQCGRLVPPRDPVMLAAALADVLDGRAGEKPDIARGRAAFDWGPKLANAIGYFAERMGSL